MKNNFESSSSKDANHNNPWDMSDVEEFSESENINSNITSSVTDEVIEPQSLETEPNPLEDLEFWSNEYRQTEIQFVKFQKSPNHPRNEQYYQQLTNYENDQAYNWQRLTEATADAQSQNFAQDDYELASIQRLSSVEPSESIEAASGAFFSERMSKLRQRINESTEESKIQQDTDFINDTWQKVYEYITAAIDYDTMRASYNQYQLIRRSRHNDMIRHLNGLNKLAESYNTPRFTLRNFMTNDFYYHQSRDKGGWLNRRANYDRETVLAYFKTVYQDRIQRFEKSARDIDLFPSQP